MWRRACCKLMSPPFRCWAKSLRKWNQLRNYGKHRMNSKRIISFGKQWQRLKRLQLFLDNVQRATNSVQQQQQQGHGLSAWVPPLAPLGTCRKWQNIWNWSGRQTDGETDRPKDRQSVCLPAGHLHWHCRWQIRNANASTKLTWSAAENSQILSCSCCSRSRCCCCRSCCLLH